MVNKCKRTKFTKSDLNQLDRMTQNNFHGQAREFIAKKMCSPTEEKFKKINKEHIKKGFLTPKLSERRNKTEEQLMKEMRKKLNPREIDKIFGAI